jgi:hypothetical protein
MPEWITSGIVDKVGQVGLEIHTNGISNDFEELSKLVDLMRNLNKVGFRLISTSNNECVGKAADFENIYFNLLEAVFYKDK